MTDLIVGMGEVGSTLFALFTSRGIDVMGTDRVSSLNRNYIDNKQVEFMHICIPYHPQISKVIEFYSMTHHPDFILIHSTLPVGTCRKIQERLITRPVISSPTNGVHTRFLEDMMRYTKHFAFVDELFSGKADKIMDGMRRRFPQVKRMSSYETCELAKILCDTTYYGLLIAYRKATNRIARNYKVNPDEMWTFAEKIQEFLNNRPIMYDDGKPIGGHCVMENLELGDPEDADFQAIRNFIRLFGS